MNTSNETRVEVTPELLAELQGLAVVAAEESGSGLWWQSGGGVSEGRGRELSSLFCYFEDEGQPRVWSWDTVGAFMAAANPAVVLALVERIRELDSEVEALGRQLQEATTHPDDCDIPRLFDSAGPPLDF